MVRLKAETFKFFLEKNLGQQSNVDSSTSHQSEKVTKKPQEMGIFSLFREKNDFHQLLISKISTGINRLVLKFFSM